LSPVAGGEPSLSQEENLFELRRRRGLLFFFFPLERGRREGVVVRDLLKAFPGCRRENSPPRSNSASRPNVSPPSEKDSVPSDYRQEKVMIFLLFSGLFSSLWVFHFGRADPLS